MEQIKRQRLDYSSPGCLVYRLLGDIPARGKMELIPKGLLVYFLCEITATNGEVFYLMQPLTSEFPAFFLLKGLASQAKEFEFLCEPSTMTH